MNAGQYFKVMYSLVDDTRLEILGQEFGDNEALGIYIRMLKIMYKDYADGIPMNDRVLNMISAKCKTDRETLDRFIALCCEPEVGWFKEIEGLLISKGAQKETYYRQAASDAGRLPPKEGSRPRGRPRKEDQS